MTDSSNAPTDKTDKIDEAPGAPIRVLIAEDQALLRTTLAALLQAEEGMSVVGTAGDGARALALTAELRPDVVLMGIQMPGLSSDWPSWTVRTASTRDCGSVSLSRKPQAPARRAPRT